jgi:hypothetical protein
LFQVLSLIERRRNNGELWPHRTWNYRGDNRSLQLLRTTQQDRRTKAEQVVDLPSGFVRND